MNAQLPLFSVSGSTTRLSAAGLESEKFDIEAMDGRTLIENFSIIIEALGGISRVRSLILGLAVRGRLVRRSEPTRETSSESISQGLEAPFALPASWVWRRVDEVGELKLGRQRSPKNHTGPNMRPYLRVANVFENRIDSSDVLEMNFEPEEVERFLLQPNDVLLNEGQSFELVGRPAIYRGEVPGACFQNTLIRFRPNSVVLSEYALIVFRAYMRTGRFRREAQQTTNIAHLSLGRLASIEFPLPMIDEQKRIVAKVDRLMALCDKLETKQSKKREVGKRLTNAALGALTSAEGPEEFQDAWKRVAENFEQLIDQPEQLAILRQVVIDIVTSGPVQGGRDFSWPRATIGEIIENTRYGTAKKCSINSSLIPVLRIPNVVSGTLQLDDLKYAAFSEDELRELRLTAAERVNADETATSRIL